MWSPRMTNPPVQDMPSWPYRNKLSTIILMECRNGCGACCITPSINVPIPGMPYGKPAGVRCVHLSEERRCKLYGSPERPDICHQFAAESIFCGTNFDDALENFRALELATQPVD